MTALTRYQRLECPGLWRDQPEAQRRDVIVSFGDASLVIFDPKSDTPLAHWSLPAVQRLNPGAAPALYAPASDAAEVLEIEEATMIAALDQIQRALQGQEPRPGRLRLAIRASVLALVAGLGLFWLPQAMTRHTAAQVPFSARAELGRRVLADLVETTGAPCNQPEGLAALHLLRDRILGPGKGDLVVVPRGVDGTARLPGNIFLISQALLEQDDNPDVVAASLVAEVLRAELSDPMTALLHHAGFRATLTMLTTGDLPAEALSGFGRAQLAEGRRAVPDATLLSRLKQLGIPATPYARAIDPSGNQTADLIAGDPFAQSPAPAPVLDDVDWVTLQGICSI